MDLYDVTVRSIETGELREEGIDGLRHVKQLPVLSVVRAMEGEYLVGMDGGEPVPTGEGGLFIAPSGVMQTIVHRVSPLTGRMCAEWAFLDVTVNESLRLDQVFRFPTVIPPSQAEGWEELFAGLRTGDVCQRKIGGYRLVQELMACGTQTESAGNQEMARICGYIRQHYGRHMTVRELAERSCMSVSNFHAVFRNSVGESPASYINNYRISVATKLLLYSGLSIGEIAARSGIGDPYYFSRMFRKKYGVSPREYRKRSRYRQSASKESNGFF